MSEIAEICISENWPYHEINSKGLSESQSSSFEEYYKSNINGISFTPTNCETMQFIFDIYLNTVPFQYLISEGERFTEYYNNDSFRSCFCKTQFAGWEMHVKIVKLLKYLDKKYFEVWECTDDSDYYHSGDLEKLKQNMGLINRMINSLTDTFESINAEHGKSLDKEGLLDVIKGVLKAEKDLDFEGKEISEEE